MGLKVYQLISELSQFDSPCSPFMSTPTPYPFHGAPLVTDSIARLLHKFSQSNNLISIKKIHAQLLRTGFLFASLHLQTNLLLSYTKSSQQSNSQTLTNFFNFNNPTNPLPFNSFISCFCHNGFPSLALNTFSFMHVNGVPIDTYALCGSLIACSSVKNVGFGKQIHSYVLKSGWMFSVFVGSALIDLYAKLEAVEDAAVVFEEIPDRNTVCANVLLSGYADAKLWANGIELFRDMPRMNLDYDNCTLSDALRLCAGLYALELGRQVHAVVIRMVPDAGIDVFLQSSLIDMYGKCGLVGKARHVFGMAGFESTGERKPDVVLWTSMLAVYGRNGYYKEVILLYKEMLMESIRPDGVAFVTVISACGHTGQVDLGLEYFESMTHDFGLNPNPEHYSCLVDLFCRAGELDKAWKIVDEMPCKGSGSVSVWGALLSACIEHKNVDLGKKAAQRALELDPKNVGVYVLLSNMYARHGMWNEIEELRELMKERGLKKDVGSSYIAITR